MDTLAIVSFTLVLFASSTAGTTPPVADAGSSRYAGTDPVQLDGTGSYDPDGSGALSYQWQQISGPTVTITDADAPRPTISGFTQTDSIQTCQFQLIVNDGVYNSSPDTVEVIIVAQGQATCPFRVESGSFDPEKPTIVVFFRGGSFSGGSPWNSKANIISFTKDIFGSQGSDNPIDCSSCGDNLIVYLSKEAPNYKQPIQTISHSGGGWTNPRVTAYLNLTYADGRYAVNHATYLDGFLANNDPHLEFLNNPVDGEQCWLESYISTFPDYLEGGSGPFDPFFQVKFPVPPATHGSPRVWYKKSLTYSDLYAFNSGVVAGAYWSVVGAGKNLQLASTYGFTWYGSTVSGHMDFYDESSYPGRLPEPVTLIAPADIESPGGLLLTCEESQNAVGYQLLVGADPHRVMDFDVISDTPAPPTEPITKVPKGAKYWTIKVRDQWGSTIHADPLRLPWLLTVDLGTLAKYWLNRCTEPQWCDSSDIDRNSIVNFIDFAKFANLWLGEK